MPSKKSIKEIDLSHGGYLKDEIEFRTKQEELLNGELDNYQIPDFLIGDDIAIDKFLFLSDELKDKKILANVDNVTIAQYCKLYSQYCDCLKELDKTGLFVEYTSNRGEKNIVESPASKLKRSIESQMLAYVKELGLSPKSRLNLSATKPNKEAKDPIADEFGDI